MRFLRFRPGITLRARLTLIYGGLFFAAGITLLAMTYVLFDQQLGDMRFTVISRGPSSTSTPSQTRGPIQLPDHEMQERLKKQQAAVRDAAITSMLVQGSVALVVVGGVAAGLGWLIAGRMLAPLRQVTDTARRIASAPAADRGLHERIALTGPHDEVKDLADTFDTMLERLDRSFDGQRNFIANASHELRTPLTLSRALVEVAMHRKSASEDVQQLGGNLLEISARHERLISGLLLLASSDRELTERHPVDLADVVRHVAALNVPEAKRAGVTVHSDSEEATTVGDALLLERLVYNLVENGIRHNVADGWLRLASRTLDDGKVALTVSNTGPVVPPYDVPTLFQPFRRIATDRRVTGNGVGLGLSIVASIARAHESEVVARPRDGGGLTVTVTLPAAHPKVSVIGLH